MGQLALVLIALALIIWAWSAPDWSPLGRALNRATRWLFLEWIEPLFYKDRSIAFKVVPIMVPRAMLEAVERDLAQALREREAAFNSSRRAAEKRERLLAAVVAAAGGKVVIETLALECDDFMYRLDRYEIPHTRQIAFVLRPAKEKTKAVAP